MSRSKPTDQSPNPATRWFEWSGSEGRVHYYDKERKEKVPIEKEFVFILLDQTATIKGWNDASESAIYSNEVKDTRASSFVVKAFKGGTIAEGFYQKIRDRVAAAGGHFTSNLYIAYKGDSGELEIGSLQFKGAALGAWMEFSKKNRADLYKKALEIVGYDEGKKGKVVFRTPKFFMKNISEETNTQALDLDSELQVYLDGYFARARVEQAEPPPVTDEDFPQEPRPDYEGDDGSEVPF